MPDILFRRGLKLTHLRLMAALAETPALGAAAARLPVTQPAASRLLAEIERIVGRPVHVRAGRGLTLTAEGAALALRAARIVTEIGEAGREIEEIAGGTAGEVRIGAVTGPALDRVLPALRTARLVLPRVAVEVEVAPSDLLGEMLLSGRLDLTVARLPAGLDHALFDFAPLEDEPVGLVVRQGHALVGRPRPSASELLAYDWILPGPGAILRRTVLARLAELGLPPPQGRIATASFLFTLALLRQSNAIAPLARSVADLFSATGGPFATLDDDLGIRVAPFGILTRAGSHLTPAAGRIRALVTTARPPRY